MEAADHPEGMHPKERKGRAGRAGHHRPASPDPAPQAGSPRLQALLQTPLAASALQRLCFSLDFLRSSCRRRWGLLHWKRAGIPRHPQPHQIWDLLPPVEFHVPNEQDLHRLEEQRAGPGPGEAQPLQVGRVDPRGACPREGGAGPTRKLTHEGHVGGRDPLLRSDPYPKLRGAALTCSILRRPLYSILGVFSQLCWEMTTKCRR